MTTTITNVRHELNRAYACLFRASDSRGHLNARDFTRQAADHLRFAGAADLADQAEYGLAKSIGHPFNTEQLMTKVEQRLAVAQCIGR